MATKTKADPVMADARQELREFAQDALMNGMQTAFCNEHLSEQLRAEMSKQFARVEHLFGYEKNTWMRGA